MIQRVGRVSRLEATESPEFDEATPHRTQVHSINPLPNQRTGGEGAVTGTEVKFTVAYNNAFSLPADNYFFVPQVAVNGGDFLWLSAAKPIVSPGTPFVGDLQSWIRNEDLEPDWLYRLRSLNDMPLGFEPQSQDCVVYLRSNFQLFILFQENLTWAISQCQFTRRSHSEKLNMTEIFSCLKLFVFDD